MCSPFILQLHTCAWTWEHRRAHHFPACKLHTTASPPSWPASCAWYVELLLLGHMRWLQSWKQVSTFQRTSGHRAPSHTCKSCSKAPAWCRRRKAGLHMLLRAMHERKLFWSRLQVLLRPWLRWRPDCWNLRLNWQIAEHPHHILRPSLLAISSRATATMCCCPPPSSLRCARVHSFFFSLVLPI